MAKDEEGIKVFVRVRPQNDREKQVQRSAVFPKCWPFYPQQTQLLLSIMASRLAC
jgi:hypothetical protein